MSFISERPDIKMTLSPEELAVLIGQHPSHLRSLHLAPQVGNKDLSKLLTDNGFEVSLDVHQFNPNEISVKLKDHTILVEGHHEDKEEDCSIAKRFTRKYTLPSSIDFDDISTTLSSDGVLTLKAHRKNSDSHERFLPIKEVGPVRHKKILDDNHISAFESYDPPDEPFDPNF